MDGYRDGVSIVLVRVREQIMYQGIGRSERGDLLNRCCTGGDKVNEMAVDLT